MKEKQKEQMTQPPLKTQLQNQQLLVTDGYFICRCSKKYKSYAAVYTHIKNKHNLSESYIEAITRPSWIKAQKGRPKKFKNATIDVEFRKLEILESGCLKMWQKLVASTAKNILLEQNEESDENEVNQEYKNVTSEFGSSLINVMRIPESEESVAERQLRKFYVQFCRHFSPQISARILWTLNYIAVYTKQNYFDLEESQHEYLSFVETDRCKMNEVWYNVDGIDKLIFKVFQEWKESQNCQEKH